MLPTMRKDAVFVDLTTASAEIARELYAQAKQRGSRAKIARTVSLQNIRPAQIWQTR